MVLLPVCHIGRGNKAAGWRQNCWGRNSREVCVCVCERPKKVENQRKIEEETMGFGACLCPGEQLPDGKGSGSWENGNCFLAGCQSGPRTNAGEIQGSCSEGDAKEFRLALEQFLHQ